MTFDNPASHPAQTAAEHELTEYQESLTKFTQQDLLRDTAIQLNINQETLAALICVPWGTFRKWLLPYESRDYRKMNDIVIRTVQLLLEVHELKRQLRGQRPVSH